MHLPPSVKFLLVALAVGVSAPGAHFCAAQSEIGGSVAGQIAVPGGRSLAGAQVRIENAATGEGTDSTPDSQGEFQFADLAPGEYTLRVRVPGLSNWEADHVLVDLGTATRLHPVLTPLTVHRTVLVDGQASQRGGIAGDDPATGLASELPNNSQHWSRFASLFADGATDAGDSVSFRGLSPLLNAITVDGADHNLAFRAQERATAGNGFATAQPAVGEFETA